MASAPQQTEMEQEAMCPICLEYLTDPVVLDCGHSFCQDCINKYCETWEALEEAPECPTCKSKIQKEDFRRNWQLANLVEKMKLIALSSRKEDLCLRHKEKLHLFCKEDEKLGSDFCERSPEHQGHTTLLMEEAAQQYKEKIFSYLKILRTEREKILVYRAYTKGESGRMLKRMESGRHDKMAEFRSLHQFLNELERYLLDEIEEMEKEIERKRDECLARLSEELSSLDSLIQEMEEKHHQQPVSELQQDVRGTLQRYEKKEAFKNPVAFLYELYGKVWSCPANPFLKSAMKQFKDTWAWAFPKRRANVILDAASTSSRLNVFSSQRGISWQRTAQDLPEDSEKHYGCALGSEGFRAGCHFWDISVGNGGGWAAGVARKPVRRRVTLTPEEGIWAVGRCKGQHKAFIKGTDPPLTLREGVCNIRVCLDYAGGRVAFFDADRAALLYEFTGASFSGETLHPFFAVYGGGWLCLYP